MPMIKPVEYKVVSEESPEALGQAVSRLLQSGYTPHGDLKIVEVNEAGFHKRTNYIQAVVKVDLVETPGTSPLAMPGVPIIGR